MSDRVDFNDRPDHCTDYDDGYEHVVGSCTNSCPRPCKGACGCEACQMYYADFMSSGDE